MAQASRVDPRETALVAVLLFLAAASWVLTVFGLAAYALYEWAAAVAPTIFAPDTVGRYVAAGAIAMAALYRLTPAKNVT